MRILITGSREWKDVTLITDAIVDASRGFDPKEVTVIVGGARGADSLAEFTARQLGLNVERHDPDWERHGKAAGFIRNQEMVDSGADICLAFWMNKSRGTFDCINRAVAARIPVRRYQLEVHELGMDRG